MSGESHKRELLDDPSLAVNNVKAKISNEDEQPLREIEPFDCIDDVILEFRSILHYVAPEKGDDFQNILERLDRSDTLVRRKQGQGVAPEERTLLDDITELRKLISQQVVKSVAVMAEFKEKMAKMRLDDQLIRKQTNHREDHEGAIPSISSEPNEDPLEHVIYFSDSASDGDVPKKNNEATEKSGSGESTEDPEEEPKMSPDDFLRKFGRLSDSELIQIILTQREFRESAFAAIKLKNNSLDRLVVEPDRKVTLSVKGKGNIEVVLDQGRDFGYQLVLLMHTVLNGYKCSTVADFEFKAPDYGIVLPFEQIFQLRNYKILIHELRMNKPELTQLFRYARSKRLYISFPSSHLFDNRGKLLVPTLKYLKLSSDEVDNVDKLIEKCRVPHIELAPNSCWSDEAVKRFLMIGDCHRNIVCHYASDHDVKPGQRTLEQWRKLFDDVRAYHEDGQLRFNINMNEDSSKQTIAFTGV